MKWGGVTIDTGKLKNPDGSTIETRLSTIEASRGADRSGIHALLKHVYLSLIHI